ncbi:MAG TPA: hypothetical protein VF426_06750 [Marmoricola sp.]
MSRIRLAAAAALVVGTLGLAGTVTAPSTAAPSVSHVVVKQKHPTVTWKGFGKVKFGMTLAKAAKKTHGTVVPCDGSGYTEVDAPSLKDVGVDNGYTGKRNVRRISTWEKRVRFPHGLRVGMTKKQVHAKLGKKMRRMDHGSMLYAMGPHGRVLWASIYVDNHNRAGAVGISINRKEFKKYRDQSSCIIVVSPPTT